MSALPYRASEDREERRPLRLHDVPRPSAVPILMINRDTAALDPYADRLSASGYQITAADSIASALKILTTITPRLIIVNDGVGDEHDPAHATGIDAQRWIGAQHYARETWIAALPLIILVDKERLNMLQIEAMPDRVVLVQRKANALDQLSRYVQRLTS